MKVIAFIQARMTSTRLPGKVLMNILGKPMLFHQVNRLKKSIYIDGIVIVTSVDETDDTLYNECLDRGVECFRGKLDDVLNRFYQASIKYEPDHIVRITGDCPLLDSTVVDTVIETHLKEEADYTSNTLIPSYPDGLDVEVFTKDCLGMMEGKATKSVEREHVSYYCYTHESEFILVNVINPYGDESNFRWTVDTKDDYEFVCAIYKEFKSSGEELNHRGIIKFLSSHPEYIEINKNSVRNEGLQKSLEKEAE